MALLVIVFSVSGGIVTEAFQDTTANIAQVEAEKIAVSVFERNGSGTVALRGPAAVGEVGIAEISQDPWGQPYHYKILRSPTGKMKTVVVSAGPNKKLESNLDKFDTQVHVFGGDDIGFVYDGSNKKTE